MQNLSNYGATLAEAEQHLAAFVPFHTGTLSAAWETFGSDWDKAYVVRSYGTVIAAATVGWATLQHDAYEHSKTTSKHANLVKKAWGI